jgi:hypothetical protein
VEYLIVWFDEDRGVIVNSAPGAWMTNQILMLEAGTYDISLAPPSDYAPPGVTGIQLDNTTVLQPCEIYFSKITQS